MMLGLEISRLKNYKPQNHLKLNQKRFNKNIGEFFCESK